LGRLSAAQLKQQLRQLRQKTAWSLNFDVNAFDFVEKVRITMKYSCSVPLFRPNGELLSGNASSRVVHSSVGSKWNDVVVEQQQHHFPSRELADVMFKRHVVVINIGHSTTWEFKKEGRFGRFLKARGAISYFPSHQPFSGRLKVERGRVCEISRTGSGRCFRQPRC
jgi:hypothetical protein